MNAGVLRLLCLITVLLLSMGPAQAGLIEDEVSVAFANGGKKFFMDLTDSLVDLCSTPSNKIEGMNGESTGLDGIITIATFTPNPYKMDAVKELRVQAEGIFFDVWWYIIILMVIGALLIMVMPLGAIVQVNEVFGFDTYYAVKQLFCVIVGGIFVFMLEMAFVWCVLVLNNEITNSIVMGSLNAIASTPDNWVLYCVMGIAYALLYLCFVYRAVVIVMFAGLSLLAGILLIFPPTSHIGWKMHLYFIQLVFFQLVVVLWYGCCIIVAYAMPPVFMDAIYQIMVLISIWLSYKFIFHLDFVKGAGSVLKIVAYKKL